jgi:hypothetical protein
METWRLFFVLWGDNKVCGFRIFAAASQQFGVVCHHPSNSMGGPSVRADIPVQKLLDSPYGGFSCWPKKLV